MKREDEPKEAKLAGQAKKEENKMGVVAAFRSMKGDFDKIFEKMISLQDEDIDVLRSLDRNSSVSDLELAAHLYFLPSHVHESLGRLSRLGLIEETDSPKKPLDVSNKKIKLSRSGEKALGLIPLLAEG